MIMTRSPVLNSELELMEFYTPIGFNKAPLFPESYPCAAILLQVGDPPQLQTTFGSSEEGIVYVYPSDFKEQND